MGNQPGKEGEKGSQGASNQPTGDEDFFILDDPKRISLKDITGNVYYWVDPKFYSPDNMKYYEFLKEFYEIKGFTSVDGMYMELDELEPGKNVKVICCASLEEDDYMKLQNDPRIPDMFLFCMNQEKAKLLMMNFSKIKVARFKIQDLKEAISNAQAEEKKGIRRANILLMVQDHIHSLNKYRLNYHCLTCFNNLKAAKKDLIKFAESVYGDRKDEILKFAKQYKEDLPAKQRAETALQWVLQDSFYWKATQDLPKITTDPKKLGYLRLPFKQISEAICQKYKDMPKNSSEVYIVMEITKQEADRLKDNENNFFTFTSFVKGFTSEKEANKQMKKSKKNYLFRIEVGSTLKFNPKFDFGYWISNKKEGHNIIFNIYNFFSIDEVDLDERQIIVKYGALADVSYRREKQREEAKLTAKESNLVRNCDYIESVMGEINTQASILQMSGYFKQSVEVHGRKIDQIRKSQPPSHVIDKHIIELGDAFRLNQDYEQAEKQYKKVTKGEMEIISLVHLAEMYYRTKKEEKLNSIIPQIEKGVQVLKDKNPPEYFKAKNFIGVSLMNKGKTKDAHKVFDDLMQKVTLHYGFKHEGIPLVHDIYRNMANCKTQLNQYKDALTLLNSTKSWQQGCEGSRSPNLVVTQNLIRSVYYSKGDMEQMRESQAHLARLNQSMDRQEAIYLERSNINIQTINQSNVNILTTANSPTINIEQSNVAINL